MALRELVTEIGFKVKLGELRDAEIRTDRIIDHIADNFRDMGTDIDRVVNNVGTSIRGIPDPRIDTSQSIRSFNDLQAEAEELRQELGRIQQEARQTDRALSSIDLGNLAGGLGGGAVGATIGLDITSFAQMERELQAGLGVDAVVAAGLKDAAKEIWSDIPGITHEAAYESVTAANRYLDAEGARARELGYDIAMLHRNSGMEVDRIGQGIMLLEDRFSDIESPEEAANLNVVALQRLGPRLYEEMMDQTEEYGGQWAAAGISGNDMIGAMIAGGEKSIYGMDKAGDAIANELVAGIKKNDEGVMEALGLFGSPKDVAEWRKDLVSGTVEERQQTIREILKGFTSIEDKGLQQEIGAGLFTTMWEEQQSVLFPIFEQLGVGYEDLGGNIRELDVVNEGALNNMKSAWRGFSAELDSIAGGVFGSMSEVFGAALPAAGAFLGAGGLGRAREVLGGLGARLAPVLGFFRTVGPLVLGFGRALGVVVGIAGGAIGIIAGLGYAGYQLYQNWDEVKGWILGVFDSIGAGAKGMANSVIGGINGVIGALNGLDIDIPDWVPKYGGLTFSLNIPEIPMLAAGGTVISPGLALVGELGPELVNLPRGAQVIPHDETMSMLSQPFNYQGVVEQPDLHRPSLYVPAGGSSPVFNSNIKIEYHGTGGEMDMKKLAAIIRREQRRNHRDLMEEYWRMMSIKMGIRGGAAIEY